MSKITKETTSKSATEFPTPDDDTRILVDDVNQRLQSPGAVIQLRPGPLLVLGSGDAKSIRSSCDVGSSMATQSR